MTVFKFQKYSRSNIFPTKNCIGEIRKIVKNEILASTNFLSYLGGEMIKVSGLGTYMG